MSRQRQAPQQLLQLALSCCCLPPLGYGFTLQQQPPPHRTAFAFVQQPRRSSGATAAASTNLHATAAPVEAPAAAATGSLPGVFDQESWASLFKSLDREAYDYDIEEIEGQIPPDLEGTLFNAGPGLFDRGGHSVRSWLDADGQMTAITFHQGKAHIRTRMIETEGYVQERAAGVHLWRGQFGTQARAKRRADGSRSPPQEEQSGGWKARLSLAQLLPTPLLNAFDMTFKNPSNTRPLVWGGRLLSCYETGLPYELDPNTLTTKGEFDIGGLLRSGQPVTATDPRIEQALRDRSGHAFTAHARVDPARNVLVGWSWKTLLTKLSLAGGLEVTFYELDADYKLACDPVTVQLPDCSAPPHDSILTEDYHVFVQYAFNLDLLPCLLGLKGPGECLVPVQGDKGKAVVHLVPRASGRFAGQPPLAFETPSAFMTHWATAHQSADGGKLVAYAAGWDGEKLLEANVDGKLFGALCDTSPGPDFSQLPIIRLFRLEVDLRKGTAAFELVKPMARTFVDFPKAHPAYEMRPARYLWCTAANDVGASTPPQGFVRFDLRTDAADSWHAPTGRPAAEQPHVFVSEAVLAARPPKEKEDPELAAYLLGMEMDARTGRRSLCVFDAGDLGKGPLCKLHLKHALPWGIHNEWAHERFWDGKPLV